MNEMEIVIVVDEEPLCNCLIPHPSSWFGYECLNCMGYIVQNRLSPLTKSVVVVLDAEVVE